MKKFLIFLAILDGAALMVLVVVSVVVVIDQRYGKPFEMESKQNATAVLGSILSNCTSENVASYVAPSLRREFDRVKIDRLCSTLSQRFGAY